MILLTVVYLTNWFRFWENQKVANLIYNKEIFRKQKVGNRMYSKVTIDPYLGSISWRIITFFVLHIYLFFILNEFSDKINLIPCLMVKPSSKWFVTNCANHMLTFPGTWQICSSRANVVIRAGRWSLNWVETFILLTLMMEINQKYVRVLM